MLETKSNGKVFQFFNYKEAFLSESKGLTKISNATLIVPQMDRLHAYWRMPYIKANNDCKRSSDPFLDIPKQDDKAVHIVWRGKLCYIVMNKFPYNGGHLLVVPYRAVADLSDLTGEERAEFFEAVIKAEDILKKALNPDAFNIGFNLGAKAGAGIPSHLHCHVVPRWDGDTNFMPVIANTRVLPEAMDTLWERLVSFA